MHSDEILNKKIDNFRKHIIFINFLKNIRRQTQKKYNTLNIYYFSMKSALKNFNDNISYKIKENHLYKLMLTFNYSSNCKIFFSNCKKQILYFKYRRAKEKFKFKSSRDFYFKKLKIKFLQGFKKLIKKKKSQGKGYKRLLNIYSLYLNKILIKKLKCFYNSKFLNSKKKNFILKSYLCRLRIFSKIELKKIEIDRLIRKFTFLSMTNIFIKRIKKIKELIMKGKEEFKNKFTKFYSFKFVNILNKYNKYRKEKNLLNNLTTKFFKKKYISRIKLKCEFNKENSPKIIKIIDLLNKFQMKEFFYKLNYYNNRIIEYECSKTVFFLKRTFLLFLNLQFSINKEISLKTDKFNNTTTIRNNITITKAQVLKKIKCFLNTKIKIKKAKDLYKRNLKIKAINKMYLIKILMIEKKQKYIISLLNFRKNFIKKAFAIIKAYRIIQNNKKAEYIKLKDQRDKIIAAHIFQSLITKCAGEINQKEEQIAKVYIRRSSRGISTALLWFKTLKNRIDMKKILNKNKEETLKKTNNIPTLHIPTSVNRNIKEDVDTLISLKNKKRAIPKKLEI